MTPRMRPPGWAATNLARNVRERRQRLRWSQAGLADALSIYGYPVGQSRVSSLERHGSGASIDLVDALAEIFGCQVSDLISSPDGSAALDSTISTETAHWLATTNLYDVCLAWGNQHGKPLR